MATKIIRGRMARANTHAPPKGIPALYPKVGLVTMQDVASLSHSHCVITSVPAACDITIINGKIQALAMCTVKFHKICSQLTKQREEEEGNMKT